MILGFLVVAVGKLVVLLLRCLDLAAAAANHVDEEQRRREKGLVDIAQHNQVHSPLNDDEKL